MRVLFASLGLLAFSWTTCGFATADRALTVDDLAHVYAGTPCQIPLPAANDCDNCTPAGAKCTTDPTDSGGCQGYAGMGRPECNTNVPQCGGQKYTFASENACLFNMGTPIVTVCDFTYSAYNTVGGGAGGQCP